MSAISVSSLHHSSHLTQTRYSDVELSSPASAAPFDFLAAYSNPFLDDFPYPTSPQTLIYNDSLPFLNSSLPTSTGFDHPISAFVTYPPPALSSYSTALESPVAQFRMSLSPPQDKALEDSLISLPKTPINSRAMCFPPLFPKSTDELPNNSPSFSLNNSPFRTLEDTTLPALLDSTSSPVVRRSQGDVTPMFGRGGEVIPLPNQPKHHRDICEDGSANPFSIAQIPDSHSPSLHQRSTPFLQRLRQCSDVLSPWGDINPAQPLSSPFILKAHSTQFASPELAATRAAQTGAPAERITGLSSSCAKRKFLLSLDSPLSEASSHSPSKQPIRSDLQAMFDKEDRKHGMSTRSRSKASSSSHLESKNSTLGTSTCQRQKRKYMVQGEIHNDDANPASSDDEIMSSPLKKKRKIHGGVGSLARRSAALNQSTSRGAGGSNYSSQAIGPLVLMYLPQNVNTKFLPPTSVRWMSKSCHRYRLPHLLPNCSAHSRPHFPSIRYFQGFTSSFSSHRFTTLKAVVLPSSQTRLRSQLPLHRSTSLGMPTICILHASHRASES
ncbi:hypothetical protein JB92DRAFT_1832672 [Gautieria morchelliformis]|nr:hypothetical protein JB92DRAFT_1832672 [Gautieria morchelliformis]